MQHLVIRHVLSILSLQVKNCVVVAACLRAIAQRANTYNTQTVDHKPLKLCSVHLALAQMDTLKWGKKTSVLYFPGFIGEIKSILKTKMAGYAYTFYSWLYTLALK